MDGGPSAPRAEQRGGGGGTQAARKRVGGCEQGPGGVHHGYGGRRAHLPLVSAAIAGHMTEAVAGMTAWALATRRGETPRRWGVVSRGCRLREREGGLHPLPPPR